MTKTLEFNFDGLVGPTHNYAGLAHGNQASIRNTHIVSKPKLAAKQGIAKMRKMLDLKIPQAILPPQLRPNIGLLKSLGFSGSVDKILQSTYRQEPRLLEACYSASSMWAANAATISPSCNTIDAKLNITPANLISNMHRAQESNHNYRLFNNIFSNAEYFKVHQPLPNYLEMADEGAANHSYLCKEYGETGLELFVYGSTWDKRVGRQRMLASDSIIRNHQIKQNSYILLQQNPEVINLGVFHNDVIFIANKNVMFYHEQAFVDWQQAKRKIEQFFNGECYFIEITTDELSVKEAVETYLFNSQLVSTSDGMLLLCPQECQQNTKVQDILENVLAGNNPIKKIEYVDIRQSMQNGGGPACLRLRVVLTYEQQKAMLPNIVASYDLLDRLEAWVDKHYRDELAIKDLQDKNLVLESQAALDEFTKITQLTSMYDFQQ